MSLEDHKERVRDEFERWSLKGDETLIDECYAPDCVWHGPGGQETRGHDGLKQMMVALEVVTVIPSLNMVVAARGDWGVFVPGDADSGMNQSLKLLKEAAVVVP